MMNTQPEELYEQWITAFNAGEPEAVLACYEPEAVLVAQPGEPPVKGHEEIAQVLMAFLALDGKIQMEPKVVIKGNDVALMSYAWNLEGRDPEGNPVKTGGQTIDVLRRQPDGSWRMAIDNPYGFQS